jgi:hypothetical protein
MNEHEYRDRRIIKCKACGYNVVVSESGNYADCLSCGWGHSVMYYETQPLREKDYVPGLRRLTYRDIAGANDVVSKICDLCGSPIRKGVNNEVAENGGNRCENCVMCGYTYDIANNTRRT